MVTELTPLYSLANQTHQLLTDIHQVVIHSLHSDHLHEAILIVAPLAGLGAVGVVFVKITEELSRREAREPEASGPEADPRVQPETLPGHREESLPEDR